MKEFLVLFVFGGRFWFLSWSTFANFLSAELQNFFEFRAVQLYIYMVLPYKLEYVHNIQTDL